MKKITSVFLLVVVLLLNGCASSTKQFSKRLRGTWQITHYGIERPTARTVTGPATGYGSITFNKNGTGSAENASIFDNITSRSAKFNFTWNNTENIVVLKGEGASFSKSWIVVTNKKDHQVWKSTDGTNQVNTLELKR